MSKIDFITGVGKTLGQPIRALPAFNRIPALFFAVKDLCYCYSGEYKGKERRVCALNVATLLALFYFNIPRFAILAYIATSIRVAKFVISYFPKQRNAALKYLKDKTIWIVEKINPKVAEKVKRAEEISAKVRDFIKNSKVGEGLGAGVGLANQLRKKDPSRIDPSEIVKGSKNVTRRMRNPEMTQTMSEVFVNSDMTEKTEELENILEAFASIKPLDKLHFEKSKAFVNKNAFKRWMKGDSFCRAAMARDVFKKAIENNINAEKIKAAFLGFLNLEVSYRKPLLKWLFIKRVIFSTYDLLKENYSSREIEAKRLELEERQKKEVTKDKLEQILCQLALIEDGVLPELSFTKNGIAVKDTSNFDIMEKRKKEFFTFGNFKKIFGREKRGELVAEFKKQAGEVDLSELAYLVGSVINGDSYENVVSLVEVFKLAAEDESINEALIKRAYQGLLQNKTTYLERNNLEAALFINRVLQVIEKRLDARGISLEGKQEKKIPVDMRDLEDSLLEDWEIISEISKEKLIKMTCWGILDIEKEISIYDFFKQLCEQKVEEKIIVGVFGRMLKELKAFEHFSLLYESYRMKIISAQKALKENDVDLSHFTELPVLQKPLLEKKQIEDMIAELSKIKRNQRYRIKPERTSFKLVLSPTGVRGKLKRYAKNFAFDCFHGYQGEIPIRDFLPHLKVLFYFAREHGVDVKDAYKGLKNLLLAYRKDELRFLLVYIEELFPSVVI